MIIVVSAVATCFAIASAFMFGTSDRQGNFWGALWASWAVVFFVAAALLEYGWSWK
jgi:hypothetical protein